jgi:hypothetical protein
MHSSILKSDDFQLAVTGEQIRHDEFFANTAATDRLGIVMTCALDGLGATSLVLAAATAFYDQIRRQAAAAGDTSFRTYPDFYTFQLTPERASYGMLDIWPDHKDVNIQRSHPALAQAIIDRSPHTLLLPASIPAEAVQVSALGDDESGRAADAGRETDANHNYDAVHLASLRRVIRHAYVYDPAGSVTDADLFVTCPTTPIDTWIAKVAASVNIPAAMHWPDATTTKTVTQSFRKVTIEEAIVRLNACELTR